MIDPKSQDEYSPEETKRRAEAAIRRTFNTPYKPHKPIGNKKAGPTRRRQRKSQD